MSDEPDGRLQDAQDDADAAARLQRLLHASIVDVASNFPDVPSSTAPKLLAALLDEHPEQAVGELLRALSKPLPSVDARRLED